MAQSLAKVYVHLIFSTKNRVPTLHESWREDLYKILGGTANNMGCQSLLVGGVEDHIHMLFQLSRTVTIATAVGSIKSTSSAWVNQHQHTGGDFHWQAGYGAFSVSHSAVETVREYIRNQKDHHHRQSFQDEFRAFLIKHDVEFDEQYVWD